MRCLKNVGPEWFSSFDVYCPQTNETDRQAKYRQKNMIYLLRVGILVMTELSVLHLLESTDTWLGFLKILPHDIHLEKFSKTNY